MWSPNRWLADGSIDEFNAEEEAQGGLSGSRVVAVTNQMKSTEISSRWTALKEQVLGRRALGGKSAESLLDRIDIAARACRARAPWSLNGALTLQLTRRPAGRPHGARAPLAKLPRL